MELSKSTFLACAVMLALANFVYQMFFVGHPDLMVAMERTWFQWNALAFLYFLAFLERIK